MKKIFLIIISLFILTSCFWTTNDKLEKNTGLELYSTGSFSVAIPRAWTKYTDNKILPKPIFWKVVLATISKNENLWFYNNFVILSQKLSEDISSYKYSILNNKLSKQDYLEYRQLKSYDFEFLDWDKSKLYVFEARYNKQSPKAIFIQIWKVCNNTWYILTIWLNQMQKDTDKYEKLFKTFKCNKKAIKK